MELTLEQKSAVESQDELAVVISSAGSGKTTVISEHTRYLLNNGVPPGEIYLITFTNSAAQEMQDRLADCKGASSLSISTIHSLAARILGLNKVPLDAILKRARRDDDFDILFVEIQRRKGHLEIPPIDHLLVDEFQDVGTREWEFITEFLKPRHLYLVGDPKQSIYGWRGATPEILVSLINSGKAQSYELTENFRSGINIVSAAQKVIAPIDELGIESVPAREEKGSVEVATLTDAQVCSLLARDGNYADWFVLCRTNKKIDEMSMALEEANIPYVTFKQGQKTSDELYELLHEPKVKLLTVHAAKGLESKNVIFFQNSLWGRTQAARDEEVRIRYVGMTRARDRLIIVKTPKKSKPKGEFCW